MKALRLITSLVTLLTTAIANASDITITSTMNPVLTTTESWNSIINACGTIAPYTGIMCSLAPMPTIRQIARDKTTGIMPLLPYSSMVSNSFIWVMYGSLKNLKSVFWANSVGFVLGTYYMIMFSRYCGPMANNLPGTVDQHWKGTSAIILFNVLLATSLPKPRARDIIGKVGMLSFIILFASPLAALKQVVESKSAASIPLPFTIASVINCLLWSMVGIYDMKDIYIWLPSVLGLCCAVVQLFLKLIYGDRVHMKRKSSVLQ